MIIAILVGVLFWLFVKSKDANPVLWAVIAGASYFVTEIIAGFIFGYTRAYMFMDYTTYFLVRIASGLIGVLIAWLIMNKRVKSKDEFGVDDFSSELVDEFLEKL
ncbi:MAG: hypothetical protein P8M19_04535 [Crocinitomicaceae bacterium]|nr:hypothetical protein [Crocinitomix sp.]MDG2440917.1 hypothetical protein [Crocinitomicaceae bacterium]